MTSNDGKVLHIQRPKLATLVDLAYDAIMRAIVDQQLKPGEQLTIDPLARQLEMSNTPVREALMRLKGERLVLQQNNRGFIVSPLLTEDEFHHLFETRRIMEIHSLRSASLEQQHVEQLAELSDSMKAMAPGSTYDHFKGFNSADNEFHRLLVSTSPNMFLFRAWEDLHFHLHIARLYIGIGIFDHGDASNEHAEIVRVVRDGKIDQAVELLDQHIGRAEERLIALFSHR